MPERAGMSLERLRLAGPATHGGLYRRRVIPRPSPEAEGIAESMYYSWKEFLEAGKHRLAGDTTRPMKSSSSGARRRT